MRNDDVVDRDSKTIINDVALEVLARRQVPQHPRLQLLAVDVLRLPQQDDQVGNAPGVFDRALVLVILPTVRQISEKHKN